MGSRGRVPLRGCRGQRPPARRRLAEGIKKIIGYRIHHSVLIYYATAIAGTVLMLRQLYLLFGTQGFLLR
jgi:hypothetical protein